MVYSLHSINKYLKISMININLEKIKIHFYIYNNIFEGKCQNSFYYVESIFLNSIENTVSLIFPAFPYLRWFFSSAFSLYIKCVDSIDTLNLRT